MGEARRTQRASLLPPVHETVPRVSDGILDLRASACWGRGRGVGRPSPTGPENRVPRVRQEHQHLRKGPLLGLPAAVSIGFVLGEPLPEPTGHPGGTGGQLSAALTGRRRTPGKTGHALFRGLFSWVRTDSFGSAYSRAHSGGGSPVSAGRRGVGRSFWRGRSQHFLDMVTGVRDVETAALLKPGLVCWDGKPAGLACLLHVR